MSKSSNNSPWTDMQTPLQIELAIRASGLTHDELAKRADVSTSSIRRLIKGDNMYMDVVTAIVNELSNHVDWLQPGDIVKVPTIQPKEPK